MSVGRSSKGKLQSKDMWPCWGGGEGGGGGRGEGGVEAGHVQ